MIEHNGKKYKVVVVTPAGRERYLSLLRKYIERDMNNGLIDIWQLWCNTNVQSDIEYMKKISIENPKIEIKEIEGQGQYDAYRIHLFFRFAQEDDTVYIRMDDDIVWVDKDAILSLVKHRIVSAEPFIVSANIINNSVFSKIHQDINALDSSHGIANGERLGELAWKDGAFAEHIHNTFKDKFSKNELLDYESLSEFYFPKYNEFSISCFAFFGKDHFVPDRDEEMWISSWAPKALQRPNMLCPWALVVHFAYHTQRQHLESKPEYYQFYKELADKI